MSKHVVRAAVGVPAKKSKAIFGVMSMDALTALQDRRTQLFDECQQLINTADTDGVDLSDEDLQLIEKNQKEIERLDKQIAARNAVAPVGTGTRTTREPGSPDNNNRRVAPQPRVVDRRNGFSSFGEFAACVRQGSTGNTPDQRLVNSTTTFGNEGSGAEGGFLVPPEFAQQIMTKVNSQENLLSRSTPLQTSRNSMVIPKDETTPWQTSGGVQVYWEGEAQAPTKSKPLFEVDTVRLCKLMALVPITEELLDDAVGIESWLRAKAPSKMAAKINTAFFRGSGVGQPLGMLNSPSIIGVAPETSQPSDSIWFQNVNKMWSRMYAPWRQNAIWLVNQDVEPQLEAMAFDPLATAGKVPAYLPPGGVSSTPYATLKGRPVVPIESCSALGDVGDIVLVDMAQYWGVTKSNGIQTDTSIHLFFDQAVTAFRFIFRLNGMPAWSAPITRENGANTLSWCVSLNAR